MPDDMMDTERRRTEEAGRTSRGSCLCMQSDVSDHQHQIKEKTMGTDERKRTGSNTAGYAAGDFVAVNKLFDEERFNASQGHGFAAERANNLADQATGHIAKVVGDDNAKNGADRWVNGTLIQTKYYATARGSINACFEDGGAGKYRYTDLFFRPMKVEVPSDQYDSAVAVMKEKILNGQIPGVHDPERASALVVKGHCSYEQAVCVAKAGTVESLTYDAATGMVAGLAAGGISATVSYLLAKAGDKSKEESREKAIKSGVSVGTKAAATTVVAGQLSKTGLNSALTGGSELVASAMGPQASAAIVNAFRSGSNIYGAAAVKSCAKLLRGNVITGCAMAAVLSAGDAVKLCNKEITGEQFTKKAAGNVAMISAGKAGFIMGQTLIPIPVVGGLIGSFVAGAVAGKVTDLILNTGSRIQAQEAVKTDYIAAAD